MFGSFVLKTVKDIVDHNGKKIVGLIRERDLIEIKCSLVDDVERIATALLRSELSHHLKRILYVDLVDFDRSAIDRIAGGKNVIRKGQIRWEKIFASREIRNTIVG